jgi:hypothetical protein
MQIQAFLSSDTDGMRLPPRFAGVNSSRILHDGVCDNSPLNSANVLLKWKAVPIQFTELEPRPTSWPLRNHIGSKLASILKK